MIVFKDIKDETKGIYQCELQKNNLKAIRRKIVRNYGINRRLCIFEECDFVDYEDYSYMLGMYGKYASLAKLKISMGDIEFYLIEHPDLAITITKLLKEDENSLEALQELLKLEKIKNGSVKTVHPYSLQNEELYIDEIMQNIHIHPLEASNHQNKQHIKTLKR